MSVSKNGCLEKVLSMAKSVQELLNIIRDSKDLKERRRATMSLSRLLEKETCPALRIRIQNSTDEVELKEAKFQLWRKELDRSLESLLDIIHNCDDEDKVDEAILAIGDQGYKEAIDTLVDLLGTTSNSHIRDAIALSLREMPDQKKTYKPLIRAIRENPDDCETLIYALQVFDCSEAAEFLVDLFIAKPNAPVARISILGCFEEGAISKIRNEVKETCCVKIQNAIKSTGDENNAEELKELLKWVMRTKGMV